MGDLLTAVVDGRDDGETNASELVREAQMKITPGRAPTKAFTMMENSPQKSKGTGNFNKIAIRKK